MADHSTRYDYFSGRPERLERALGDDIKLWHETVQEDTIKFHIGQFQDFCGELLKHLKAKLGGRSEANIFLRNFAIGALTSEWRMLRQLASQRLDNGPYKKDLAELDQEAARYYQIVRQTLLEEKELPQKTRDSLTDNTPLVHLGSAFELTFFNNQNQKAPALISVPFGARTTPQYSGARLSLAHEVGHAVFNRIPDFFSELSAKVEIALDPQTFDHAVQQMIIDWLGEMVPDLVGVSMAGKKFVESSFEAMAVPKEIIAQTDKTHPLPIIRPYISQHFLKYMHPREVNLVPLETVNESKEKVDAFSQQYHELLVSALPGVARLDIGTVKDKMVDFVGEVLEAELKSLGNRTLGEILIECNRKCVSDFKTEVHYSSWGKGLVDFDKPFYLDLSNLAAPEFGIPVAFPNALCYFFKGTLLCPEG